MPIALHRGEIIWFSRGDITLWDGTPMSRKHIEKKIKQFEHEIEQLEANITDIKPSEAKEGNYVIYLNVDARRGRGDQMGHCLGQIDGGPGVPYIAVGLRDITWGFRVTEWFGVELQQCKGRHNAEVHPTKEEQAKAIDLAAKYARQASWGDDNTEYDRLCVARSNLRSWRRLEFAWGYFNNKISPHIMFDSIPYSEKWRYTLASNDPKCKEFVTLARELGYTVNASATDSHWYEGRAERTRWYQVELDFKCEELDELITPTQLDINNW